MISFAEVLDLEIAALERRMQRDVALHYQLRRTRAFYQAARAEESPEAVPASNGDQEASPLAGHDIPAQEPVPEPQDQETPPESGAETPDSDEAPAPFDAAVAELVDVVAEGAESVAEKEPAPRPMPALGAAWTAEEERRLLALRAEGLTAPEVADRLGRTVKAVEVRFNKLRRDDPGIGLRKPGPVVDQEQLSEIRRMRAQGLTCPQIGERLGMTGTAVKLRLMRAAREAKVAERAESQEPAEPVQKLHKLPAEASGPRRNMDGSDISEIERLAAEGLSPAEIAARLGIKDAAIEVAMRPMPGEAEGRNQPENITENITEPEPDTTPEPAAPPAPVAPKAESLPAVRTQGTTPAHVALVTEAIEKVRSADRPVLGDLGGGERPPASGKATTAMDLRRRIEAHLDVLGHAGGWTPARDLDLSERAVALGGSALIKAEVERFKALCAPIRQTTYVRRDGHPVPQTANSPEGQEILLKVLRERAAASNPMAAE